MNNQRKTVLLRLLVGRKRDINAYPMTQALADLYDYEHAGTLIGAINTIQTDAGAKAEKLDREVRHITPATIEQINDGERIRIAVAAALDDASQKKRVDEINRILKEVGDKKFDFIKIPDAQAALEEAVRAMKPEETKKWIAALKL